MNYHKKLIYQTLILLQYYETLQKLQLSLLAYKF